MRSCIFFIFNDYVFIRNNKCGSSFVFEILLNFIENGLAEGGEIQINRESDNYIVDRFLYEYKNNGYKLITTCRDPFTRAISQWQTIGFDYFEHGGYDDLFSKNMYGPIPTHEIERNQYRFMSFLYYLKSIQRLKIDAHFETQTRLVPFHMVDLIWPIENGLLDQLMRILPDSRLKRSLSVKTYTGSSEQRYGLENNEYWPGDYRSYYTKQSADLVYDIFSRDFDVLNYEYNNEFWV